MSASRRIAPFALLATVALFAVASCGGGDEDRRGAPATDAATGERSGTGGAADSGERPSVRGGEASIEDFGEEAAGAERAAILAAFEGYLGALAASEHAVACAHLSATVRASLRQLAGPAGGGAGCATLLAAILAPTAAASGAGHAGGEVTRVRVEDDRAFVVFRAPGAKLYQQTMVREGGDWRTSTVAAAVLVPDL